jgi:hypothetical protein
MKSLPDFDPTQQITGCDGDSSHAVDAPRKKICLIFLAILLATGACDNAMAGIGISYEQATQYLDSDFKMQKSSPVNGRDRYMSMSTSDLAILEIIGQKHDITQASLTIGIPNDVPAVLTRHSAMLLRFLKNTVPDWAGSSEWAVNTIQKVANGGDEATTIKGRKAITMKFIKPLGMLIVTVKEK